MRNAHEINYVQEANQQACYNTDNTVCPLWEVPVATQKKL